MACRVFGAVVALFLLAGCADTVTGAAQTASTPVGFGTTPAAVRPVEPTAAGPTSAGSSDTPTPTVSAPAPADEPSDRSSSAGSASGGPAAGAAFPSWLTPGLRVTYQVLGANLALKSVWRADPNGTWVDKATGQHYSEQSVGGASGGQNGAAGEGLAQYDIAGIDGSSIAYTKTSYLSSQGSLLATAATANEESDGNLLDVYLSPSGIQGMVEHPEPGFIFVYGPFQLGQRTFQAFAAINTSSSNPGSEIIDTQTGLLLQVFTSVNTTDAGGSPASQVSFVQLDSVRQLKVPGLGGHSPSWVGQSGTLTYTGTNAYADAVNHQTTPVTETIAYQKVFGELTQATPTVNGKSNQPLLAGPSGPYWIDPAALAQLAAGQKIDSDPLTGATLTVQSSGNGTVVINSVDGGVTTTATFDAASGALQQLVSRTQNNTLSLTLQSK